MKRKPTLILTLFGLIILAVCVFAAVPQDWGYGAGRQDGPTPNPAATQDEAQFSPPQATASPTVQTRVYQQNYELVIGSVILLAIIIFGVLKFPVHRKDQGE